MKKIYGLAIMFALINTAVFSQDEGIAITKDRFEMSKGIFVGGGPSFTLGKNIGDYSTGFNFELGFQKRVNRVLSIGPSISYISFKYDPKETGENNVFIGNEEAFDGSVYLYYLDGVFIDFKGGDLSLISASFNIKLNLIPVRDDSKVSVYVFAKPFITSYTRKEVKGTATIFRYYDINNDGEYTADEVAPSVEYSFFQVPWEANDPTWQQAGVNISDDLKKDSKITGGIFVGPGIEFMPARPVSIYVQASIGYTFPVTFISTEKYEGNDLDTLDEKYPVAKQGFPSVNIQAGVTFNF